MVLGVLTIKIDPNSREITPQRASTYHKWEKYKTKIKRIESLLMKVKRMMELKLRLLITLLTHRPKGITPIFIMMASNKSRLPNICSFPFVSIT